MLLPSAEPKVAVPKLCIDYQLLYGFFWNKKYYLQRLNLLLASYESLLHVLIIALFVIKTKLQCCLI